MPCNDIAPPADRTRELPRILTGQVSLGLGLQSELKQHPNDTDRATPARYYAAREVRHERETGFAAAAARLFLRVCNPTTQPLTAYHSLLSRHLACLFAYRAVAFVHFRLRPSSLDKYLIGGAYAVVTGGKLRFSDIAMVLGYSEHSHFTRRFKANTGLTPTEFARAARQGNDTL
jgi:AraC-like DNA-binding protein